MNAMVLGVLKWWLIIAFAGVTFFLFYPKYEATGYPDIVINSITGELCNPNSLNESYHSPFEKLAGEVRKESFIDRWITEDQHERAVKIANPDLAKLKYGPNEFNRLIWCPRCAKDVPVFIRTVVSTDSIKGIQRKEELHCRKCQYHENQGGTLIETHVIGENVDELKAFFLDGLLEKELEARGVGGIVAERVDGYTEVRHP